MLIKTVRSCFFNVLFIVCFLCPAFLNAQVKKIIFEASSNEQLPQKLKKTLTLSKGANTQAYLTSVRFKLIKQGYFLASIDSVSEKNDSVRSTLYIGPKFKRIALEFSPDDYLFLRRLRYEGLYRNREELNLSAIQLSSTMEEILDCLTQNGYPFAQISLVNCELNSTDLKAKLKIVSGLQYTWKSIQVKGDSTFSAASIQSITGIHIGDTYDEEQWRALDQKLKQVMHIQVIKASELLFTPDGVELFLYLKSARISSFNGAVGLQPNPISQKIGLTGELQLKLVNTLRQAEQIDFFWRSIQPATQSLMVKINYPYLFKSSFGTDFKFNLYKRDSTFLEIKSAIAIQYQFKNGNFLKGIYQYYSSDRLSGATSSVGFSQSVSCKTSAYGLAFLKNELNYIPNPSKGQVINVELFVGNRLAKADSAAAVSSTIFKGALSFQKYFRLAARHVVKGALSYDFYYAPTLYQNERFRFGGLTTLRGFNEEELFGTSKAIATLEYRFLVDKNSAAFVFYDQAFYEDRSNLYVKDMPFGTGVGFSIGSKIGIFSISYAIGKQFNNPIDLKQGKVHFGYIAYF